MTSWLLAIDDDCLAAVRAAAEAAYPQECCGLLVGRRLLATAETDETGRYLVTRVVPAANLHHEPRRGFALDPAAHFALLRQLRFRRGDSPAHAESVLGHYHSHPDGDAVPSPRDCAEANDPDLLWMIAAVHRGRFDTIAAWRPRAEGPVVTGFTAVPIAMPSGSNGHMDGKSP
jgi:proteasome lid subunit RPN8/RPN11